jgi:hypothetical protein
VVEGVLGAALIVATWGSIMTELVVPRGGYGRVVAASTRLSRFLLGRIASRRSTYEAKDKSLALMGPSILVGALIAWLLALLIGYALLMSAVTSAPIGRGMVLSGSALFTLGFATNHHPGPLVVTFLAAASGPLLIALQIAYLPTIYSAFNRRETLVTLLQYRAGAPAWGPEVLARHHLVKIMGSLPVFYDSWERWAADLAESHSTYPVLLTLRSPHPLRSWLISLLAVMDSAAIYRSLCPAAVPIETRSCLRMGFTCLWTMADTLHIKYDADPMPDGHLELTFREFEGAVGMLAAAGFPAERDAATAWPDFRGWRVNYESTAYQLADLLDAPPAPWSGPRRSFPGIVRQPTRPFDRIST